MPESIETEILSEGKLTEKGCVWCYRYFKKCTNLLQFSFILGKINVAYIKVNKELVSCQMYVCKTVLLTAQLPPLTLQLSHEQVFPDQKEKNGGKAHEPK